MITFPGSSPDDTSVPVCDDTVRLSRLSLVRMVRGPCRNAQHRPARAIMPMLGSQVAQVAHGMSNRRGGSSSVESVNIPAC